MNNAQAKKFCLSLMEADTEEEAVVLLKDAGFWENRAAWRFYGDYENNYNTIGNQQSRPDSALVEKLVNSVDARLMNECLVRGIDPEGSFAPQTIQQAVAQFFDDSADLDSVIAGRIREWPDAKRTKIARDITLTATGAMATKGNPCFTISDCGEGQTPTMMPDTLLSLNRSNKLRIPFVQGKFNMGGTGVLKFCGRYNLQLILSRRNPVILNGKRTHPSDSEWGFTIVRREDPEGNRRSSVYTYLAPLDMDGNPNKGDVLRFTADTMPIFPEGRNAYARESEWGTLIKLYEYSATGYKTHILRKDAILSRIDLLLPDVALPIRLHECRSGYGGHEGSFETTLTGVGVRLDDDKGDNLETGFPSSCPMSAAGEQMTATIYAFKKGRADTYRKNEGIIFTLNGQTHGHLTTDFFHRKKAGGLSYLADSILVIVDCSKFSGRAREELFMNSRDRLSGGDLRADIEHALEDLLRHHDGLRALKESRRREEIASKLDDAKPLEDILKSLLKQSPTLSALFLRGQRISTPFKTIKVQDEEEPFEGKRYPTHFKFKGQDYGTKLQRDCHINMRCRVAFETDVVNDYFSRKEEQGEFSLHIVAGDSRSLVGNYVMNLQNGIANLSVELPANCRIGDSLRLVATVTDPTLISPFENTFVIRVKEAIEPRGERGDRRKPPTKKEGKDRETPSGIQLPKITLVFESEWGTKDPPFDKYTALRIKNAGVLEDSGNGTNEAEVYDFYVNMDNLYLKNELKSGGKDIQVIKARFQYGLVLLGLALLQQEAQTKKARTDNEDAEQNEESEEDNIEKKVEAFSKAVAPVLLPMIESLGTFELDSTPPLDGSGEAT